MAAHRHRVGIDFGTSNTVAVLAWPDGRVTPLLFDGSPLLPSAVYADHTGTLLVGRDALHAALTGPDRFEPHPKRRIDDETLLLGTAEVPVVELVAAVLARVEEEARRVSGNDPSAVVLTYPAAWGPRRRGLLQAAATAAGLAEVKLVAEPVAAAAFFVAVANAQVPVGSAVVVYDFGAGTFDASVVRRTADGFDVLATRGLEYAGGLDVDAAIVAHLAAAYAGHEPQAWQRLSEPGTPGDRRAARQLWDHVRSGKEALSHLSSTLIHLPLVDLDAPLGREQLDQLARPVVAQTVAETRAVLRDAAVDATQVAGVFLVGGSSRLPLAASALHRGLGVAPTIIEQPELVVAQGSLHVHALPDVEAPGPQPAGPQPAVPTRSAAEVSGSDAPVPDPPDATSSAPAGEVTTRQHRWRNRRTAILAAMLSVVLAAVVGTLWSQWGADPTGLTGSESGGPGTTGPTKALSGPIEIDGSGRVRPLSDAARSLFESEQPDVKITVGESGTGAGFNRFCTGQIDVAQSSRPINDFEKKACLDGDVTYAELVVAIDALAVVVSRENTWTDCLTVAQLKRIWDRGSTVKKWNEVGPTFPGEPLTPFGPGTYGGAVDYFTLEINGAEQVHREDFTELSEDNLMVQSVAGAKGGTGYLSLAKFGENATSLKAVKVDAGQGCVEPTVANAQTGAYRPLSRPLFLYVSSSAAKKEQVRGFLDFYIATIEKTVAEASYIPLTSIQEVALKETFEAFKKSHAAPPR